MRRLLVLTLTFGLFGCVVDLDVTDSLQLADSVIPDIPFPNTPDVPVEDPPPPPPPPLGICVCTGKAIGFDAEQIPCLDCDQEFDVEVCDDHDTACAQAAKEKWGDADAQGWCSTGPNAAPMPQPF